LANRRILFAVPLALVVVAAVKYRARRMRWTWQPDTVEEEEPSTERPEMALVVPVRRATPSLFTLLSSALGLACLITAQWLLLQSRHPIAPLALYVLGFTLLIPLLSFHIASWSYPGHERQSNYQTSLSPRWHYLIAAAFF
jgi:hypothetical protein